LRGANLQEANLTGAKLNSAQLTGANMYHMIDVQGHRVAMMSVSHPRPRGAKKVQQPWWKFWQRA
jgi:hypothetical protein